MNRLYDCRENEGPELPRCEHCGYPVPTEYMETVKTAYGVEIEICMLCFHSLERNWNSNFGANAILDHMGAFRDKA